MRNFFCVPLFLLVVSLAQAKTWQGHAGPWGELMISSMYLEAPNSVIEVVPKPNSVTRWSFPGNTPSGVKSLLIKAGVQGALVESLTTPPKLLLNVGEVLLYPSLDDLLQLSAATRDTLYAEIAKSEQNEHYFEPVYILSDDVEEWLEKSNLSKAQVEIFRRLVWHRGTTLVFSDISALLSQAESKEEIDNTIRAVTRNRTLLVSQKFPLKHQTAKEFLEYWFAGQSESPRMTFIKAISKETDINDTVDIMHFFPVLMRERTYTFPSIRDATKGRMPDCHWTSLNFFNLTPRDYYRNTKLAALQFTESYDAVSPPYRFGDILCYIDNGNGLHTCVYIADDIVLTKNGENILSPWVLLYVSDVSKIYKQTPTTTIQGYRLNKSH
jgi:hypothetical protein